MSKHDYEDIVLKCEECGYKNNLKNHGYEGIIISHFRYFEKKHKRNIRTIDGHQGVFCPKCSKTTRFVLFKFNKNKI